MRIQQGHKVGSLLLNRHHFRYVGNLLISTNFNYDLSRTGRSVFDLVGSVKNFVILFKVCKMGLSCFLLGWYGFLFSFYKLGDLVGREFDSLGLFRQRTKEKSLYGYVNPS